MEHLNGLAPLVPHYDGYIIDLWGVVHDGVRPYPGAIDCLARLKAAGKRAVLLSNAPRRSAVAQAAMRAMGIPDSLYFGILTSGEATHQMLAARNDPFLARLGRRMFHLGPETDRNVYEGLDLEVVDTPEAADFVLNTGPDETRGLLDLAPYEDLLLRMRARDLPMVCANPDLEVIRGGVPTICAGTLAQRYEALGGRVRWIGKPDPAVYAPVLALLGCPRERVLAIGDALRTDIVGAKAAGVASAWVLGGIHNHLLGDPAAAEAAAAAEGLAPVATLPALRWE
jgi:HAD superfamily hydrolase (TIGR01459 family)